MLFLNRKWADKGHPEWWWCIQNTRKISPIFQENSGKSNITEAAMFLALINGPLVGEWDTEDLVSFRATVVGLHLVA